MVRWIQEIKIKKLLLCGVIYTIAATFIHQIEAVFTMKYYLLPQYFGVWSKFMMPRMGPPPPEFFMISVIFTFTSGISLALVYLYIRQYLPKAFKQRVLLFADLMIGMSFIFFTLPCYLLFNLPVGLLVSWFISSFIILVIASFTFVKVLH
jgi:hypothetical protein